MFPYSQATCPYLATFTKETVKSGRHKLHNYILPRTAVKHDYLYDTKECLTCFISFFIYRALCKGEIGISFANYSFFFSHFARSLI
jgi:hypothetical protein